VRPTRLPVLVVAAAVTAVLAWLLARAAYPLLSPLPWLTGATPVLLAVAELITAVLLRARLRGARGTRPVHPIDVARIAALAKASSVGGAVLVGAYGGIALAAAAARARLAVAGDDLVAAVLGAASGLLLVVAALLLERVCRVPSDRGG
jgi:hypothetical protein